MASNPLKKAEKLLGIRAHYSESIPAAQVCVELTVKAELAIFDIKFPQTHDWEPGKKGFAEITHQIQERQLILELAEQYLEDFICLPKMLCLVNFLARSYTTAMYGFEAEYLVMAKDLFGKEDTERVVLGEISGSAHFGDRISTGVEVIECQ